MRGRKHETFEELMEQRSIPLTPSYPLEEADINGFEGTQFGCRIYETHIPGWYLTDYDHRYFKQPDIYKSPNLVKKTGHFALFTLEGGLGRAKHVAKTILQFRDHATNYINMTIK